MVALCVVGAGCSTDGDTAVGGAGVAAVATDEIDGSSEEAPPRFRLAGEEAVSVAGGVLLGDGEPLVLYGVNRSGAEYACAQGWGFFDGDEDQALVDELLSWNVNAVRVLLNEHCWLGVNGVAEEFGGEPYRAEIRRWIDLLRGNGLVAVVALQWADGGEEPALDIAPMPNRRFSEPFWASVADEFGDEPGIVFELYSEPHDVSWDCWQTGCDLDDGTETTSLQALVDVVRAQGVATALIVNGLRYSNDVTELLERLPVDPMDQLIAGMHIYDFNECADEECWSRDLGDVLGELPVMITEFGEEACDGSFAERVIDWAVENQASALAWTFNPWGDCGGGPDLVEDVDGRLVATPYGEAVRARFGELG